MSNPYDSHLMKLLSAHTAKLGKAGELRMVDTLFSFLARHTSVLSNEASVNKVEQLLKRYTQEALNASRATTASTAAATSSSSQDQDNTDAAVEELVTPGARGIQGSAGAVRPNAASESKTRAEPTSNPKTEAEAKPKRGEAKEDKEEDEEEDTSLLPPTRNNGGFGNGYEWSQTLREVQVLVPLDSTATAKQCFVDFEEGDHLVVRVKDQTILDADLEKPVDADASLPWTIDTSSDGKRTLTIPLTKKNKMEWWSAVCVGEPKINTKKIEPESAKVDDLDGDTRQMVTKMMYDQRAKALGKPTMDEMQKMEALEKFKKANPNLDFSNAKISM